MTERPRKGMDAALHGGQMEEFLRYLEKVRGASPHTLSAYRRDLSQYLDYLEAKGLPGDRPESVKSFLATCSVNPWPGPPWQEKYPP